MLKKFIPKPAALLAAILACAAIPPMAFGGDATTTKTKVSEEEAQKQALREKKMHEPFWQRLNEAFGEQMATPCYVPPTAPTNSKDAKETAPTPCRRGLPPASDSPPYPDGEYQIGGTQTIGDPEVIPPYPITQAFYDGPNGDFWQASRIQLYGWEDLSGNISSSHNVGSKYSAQGESANFPEVYDVRPNRVEQNQFVVYLERQPDECQEDHLDWGFRVSAVYGLDYRFMISRGFMSNQLLVHNNYYGLDMPMMYYNLYVPHVFMGMNITMGRVISEADIEAQLAPNNLMSSHSLLYGFDPYTDWGIFFTVKLTNNWTYQFGFDAGGDVAPWQRDPGREPTFCTMLQYISSDNKWSIYGGANQLNRGNFGYNNLQQFVETITYQFTPKVWTTWETWYMYMKGTSTHPTSEVPYQNGFFTTRGGYAAELATLDYVMVRLADNTFVSWRNEFFNDMNGSRTGYTSKYYETSIGLTWWPNKLLTIRPELRYDHSFEALAFDNGIRHGQVTAQMDCVFHF